GVGIAGDRQAAGGGPRCTFEVGAGDLHPAYQHDGDQQDPDERGEDHELDADRAAIVTGCCVPSSRAHGVIRSVGASTVTSRFSCRPGMTVTTVPVTRTVAVVSVRSAVTERFSMLEPLWSRKSLAAATASAGVPSTTRTSSSPWRAAV